MTIHLADICPIEEPKRYKVHFARYNQRDEPLDVFIRNREEWRKWQETRRQSNWFNRQYIFSLIDYYFDTDIWLFGGVWEVKCRYPDRYDVDLTNRFENFIGRLKLHSPYRQRAARVNLETVYHGFTVNEVLKEIYSGETFPGKDWIDIGFAELEAMIRNNRSDWRSALEDAKGIYLLTDTRTGKFYVGAAYGDRGIWSRWSDYIESGHGGNVELEGLLKNRDLDYCRQHFRFSLLESHSSRIADDTIVKRETYWKRVLRSRGALGLNRN